MGCGGSTSSTSTTNTPPLKRIMDYGEPSGETFSSLLKTSKEHDYKKDVCALAQATLNAMRDLMHQMEKNDLTSSNNGNRVLLFDTNCPWRKRIENDKFKKIMSLKQQMNPVEMADHTFIMDLAKFEECEKIPTHAEALKEECLIKLPIKHMQKWAQNHLEPLGEKKNIYYYSHKWMHSTAVDDEDNSLFEKIILKHRQKETIPNEATPTCEFLWLDYFSVNQANAEEKKKALLAIPAIIQNCTTVHPIHLNSELEDKFHRR